MKTIKVSEATNTQLDWLVAKCEGPPVRVWPAQKGMRKQPEISVYHPNTEWNKFHPSTSWSQMGPIIERERISTDWDTDVWNASMGGVPFYTSGPTPLIAAARCYVMSKLGYEAEVPEELS